MKHTGGLSLTEKDIYREIRRITAVCDPDGDVHGSDMMEVALVLSGSGIYRDPGQSVPCAAGEIYIIPENTPHGFFVSEQADTLLLDTLRFRPGAWFDGDILTVGHPLYCHGVFRDGTSLGYAKLTNRTVAELSALTAAISAEIAEERSEWREAVKAYLSLLFITVSRYVETAIKTNPDVPKKERGVVAAVLRTIEARYGDSTLTLEDVAASLFVSPAYLSRSFRRYMGQSFSDFVRNYRMDRACKMLDETDLTVTEIIHRCGLSDIPSFFRAFRRYQGTTPNQYRHRAQERERGKNNKTNKGDTTMSILNEISENLQIGKAKIVKELVQKALDDGIDAKTILEEGLISGMDVVGQKFKNNEIYIPEVLVAARALNMGTQVLKPFFNEANMEPIGRVCIGTVAGDLHDIGKNLVKMMMEGKQLEVIDLGTDVPAETFVKTAIEQNCQVICCSALLTTTMGVMQEVVERRNAAGMQDKIKIMIGGAPVNEDYCKKIGADVYTVDSASAADAAVEICRAMKA